MIDSHWLLPSEKFLSFFYQAALPVILCLSPIYWATLCKIRLFNDVICIFSSFFMNSSLFAHLERRGIQVRLAVCDFVQEIFSLNRKCLLVYNQCYSCRRKWMRQKNLINIGTIAKKLISFGTSTPITLSPIQVREKTPSYEIY